MALNCYLVALIYGLNRSIKTKIVHDIKGYNII